MIYLGVCNLFFFSRSAGGGDLMSKDQRVEWLKVIEATGWFTHRA